MLENLFKFDFKFVFKKIENVFKFVKIEFDVILKFLEN